MSYRKETEKEIASEIVDVFVEPVRLTITFSSTHSHPASPIFRGRLGLEKVQYRFFCGNHTLQSKCKIALEYFDVLQKRWAWFTKPFGVDFSISARARLGIQPLHMLQMGSLTRLFDAMDTKIAVRVTDPIDFHLSVSLLNSLELFIYDAKNVARRRGRKEALGAQNNIYQDQITNCLPGKIWVKGLGASGSQTTVPSGGILCYGNTGENKSMNNHARKFLLRPGSEGSEWGSMAVDSKTKQSEKSAFHWVSGKMKGSNLPWFLLVQVDRRSSAILKSGHHFRVHPAITVQNLLPEDAAFELVCGTTAITGVVCSGDDASTYVGCTSCSPSSELKVRVKLPTMSVESSTWASFGTLRQCVESVQKKQQVLSLCADRLKLSVQIQLTATNGIVLSIEVACWVYDSTGLNLEFTHKYAKEDLRGCPVRSSVDSGYRASGVIGQGQPAYGTGQVIRASMLSFKTPYDPKKTRNIMLRCKGGSSISAPVLDWDEKKYKLPKSVSHRGDVNYVKVDKFLRDQRIYVFGPEESLVYVYSEQKFEKEIPPAMMILTTEAVIELVAKRVKHVVKLKSISMSHLRTEKYNEQLSKIEDKTQRKSDSRIIHVRDVQKERVANKESAEKAKNSLSSLSNEDQKLQRRFELPSTERQIAHYKCALKNSWGIPIEVRPNHD